jgi:hypothetical protein
VPTLTELDVEAITEIQETTPLGQVVAAGPHELRLRMPLRLDGGVTTLWLLNALEHFIESCTQVKRLAKKRQKRAAMRPVVQKALTH